MFEHMTYIYICKQDINGAIEKLFRTGLERNVALRVDVGRAGGGCICLHNTT